ncbi:unnamed protein product [Plutella xylostella]|uniref:(diamondback moth) hypothetical protein n=1 Tax=Plutella xylostella TaxID=51655 RepID=A0A8S4GD99_PLUXY|nr:unnamed protein product [Plutella xylostella]
MCINTNIINVSPIKTINKCVDTCGRAITVRRRVAGGRDCVAGGAGDARAGGAPGGGATLADMRVCILLLLVLGAAAQDDEPIEIDVVAPPEQLGLLAAGVAAGGAAARAVALEPGEALGAGAALCGRAARGRRCWARRRWRRAARGGGARGRPLLLVEAAPRLPAARLAGALALLPGLETLGAAGAALLEGKGWRRAVLLHEGSAARAALLAPDPDRLELQARALPPPEDHALLRSDSEYESVVSLPHTSKSKTAVAAPNKRKNNSAEPQRTNKKKKTSGTSKLDIFGILDEAENLASRAAPDNYPISSSFVSRVANGSVRKSLINDGEFYVELKVYNTLDAKTSKPEERWKKALFNLKLLTEQDGEPWQALQKFVREAHSVFGDCEPVYYSEKFILSKFINLPPFFNY